MTGRNWTRRDTLQLAAAMGISTFPVFAEERRMIDRPIPASGERLPVIGLGTYSVFDVPSTAEEIARAREIVDLLTGEGGSVIDTSPMYNRSEAVIGDIIRSGAPRKATFIFFEEGRVRLGDVQLFRQ